MFSGSQQDSRIAVKACEGLMLCASLPEDHAATVIILYTAFCEVMVRDCGENVKNWCIDVLTLDGIDSEFLVIFVQFIFWFTCYRLTG